MPIAIRIHWIAFFCFFCFFQAASSKGQPVFLDVVSAQNKYSRESFILLQRKDAYTVKIADDSLDIVRHRTEQYLYLKKMSALGGERSISSSAFIPLTAHRAYMYQPRGQRYSRVEVPAPKVRANTERHIFSDDQVEYVYSFSGLDVGTVIELQSTHQIREPRFFPATFFQTTVPVYSFDLNIQYEDGVNMAFVPYNMDSIAPVASYNKRTRMHSVHYSLRDIPAIANDKSSLPLRYTVPHCIPVVQSYRTQSGVDIPVLGSVSDLYRWYYGFIDSLNPPYVYSALQPLSDSLCSGATTDLQKAESIYYWVQSSIQYIAFESGMDGLIPRSADEVYRKRFGDCKDKTSLLHVLLRNAGLRSYITWVGTDELPYRYDEVPSPVSDNHMIVVLELDSAVYFLDATSRFQHISRPANFIQGKEALASVDAQRYKIYKVPEVPARQNAIADSVWLELLPSGELKGKGLLNLYGTPKQNLQIALLGNSADSQRKTIEGYVQLGNNTCTLDSYSISGLESYDTVIGTQYAVTIANYARMSGRECYLNLNMYRGWEIFDIEPGRTSALYINYRSMYRNVFTLAVPPGYEIKNVPRDESLRYPLFGFDTRYTVSDSTVRYEHTIYIDTRIVAPDMFAQWRDFMSALKKSYRQAIVLERE